MEKLTQPVICGEVYNMRSPKVKKIIIDLLLYLVVMIIFSISFEQDIENVFFGKKIYQTGPGYLFLDIIGFVTATTFLILDLKNKL